MKIKSTGEFIPQSEINVPKYARKFFVLENGAILLWKDCAGYIPYILVAFDGYAMHQENKQIYIDVEAIIEYFPQHKEKLEELIKDCVLEEAA